MQLHEVRQYALSHGLTDKEFDHLVCGTKRAFRAARGLAANAKVDEESVAGITWSKVLRDVVNKKRTR